MRASLQGMLRRVRRREMKSGDKSPEFVIIVGLPRAVIFNSMIEIICVGACVEEAQRTRNKGSNLTLYLSEHLTCNHVNSQRV